MKQYPIYYGILVLCLLSIALHPTIAQQPGSTTDMLKCILLKDSLQVEESGFSFNNINLSNTTGSRLDLEINFLTPDFIEIISGKEIKTSIEPSENKIIPFRFQFSRRSVAVGWYAVKAEIKIRQTGEIIKRIFFLRPKESNNWKASLRQPSMTFTSSDRELIFELLVQNSGNTPDAYKINFQTELRLDLPRKTINIDLQPGAKTVIPIRILLNPKESQFMVRAGIDISIRNKKGEQKLMQQFISLIGNLYTGNSERWNKMPLTMELNMQDLAGKQPFTYLNALGTLHLNKDSKLSIQYQSNHYYKTYSVNAQIARLEYENRRVNLGLGSIVDFNNFLVDGNGGRLTFTTNQDAVYQIMAAKSRTGQSQYYNARINSNAAKNISVATNIIANQDRSTNVNSYLALNRIDLKLNKTAQLSIEAGGGMDQISKLKLDTSLRGFQGGYLFEKSGKAYQFRSNVNYYSKNFPGFNKGFEYQSHELRWFSKAIFAGVYMEKNNRSYNFPRDSSLNFLFNMRSTEYGIKTGFRMDKGSVVFSPGFLSQRQDSSNAIEAKMYKMGINANYQFSENVSFSVYSNIGHVFFTDPGLKLKSFNSINNLMTFQASLYGVSLRYDNGAYNYYEIKQFLGQQTNLNRLQISPFVEIPLRKWHLSYRTQVNYMKETPGQQDMLLLYNNLQYSSYKKGLDLNLMGQWNVKSKQDPFINLVIRKKLKVPVLLNRNSANMIVRLYLDKNADGKFNGNDEPVDEAIVIAGDAMVMTNKVGTIEFENIERKAMKLDLGHISHLKGWIPKGGYNQLVMPGAKGSYDIPFSKSRIISGSLMLTRDTKSALTMELDAIRLIAVSSTGETYNALTNAAGEFFFNLPAGDFTVSINQGVFDENFRPVETTKLADLINNEEIKLQFEIRQKKRQINLHKQ